MVYTAPRQEIEDLKALFSRIGWPLTGISIVPFSVQNLFRTGWIPALEGTVASLFIGNDFSRIDIYSADNLVMTRGIKAGLSSMVEALVERFNERKQDPETPALTIEQGRKIIRSLSPDSPPLQETDAGVDLRKEDIFEMIQPALERLSRQVERTFEHYATMMPGERIVRIYVSGAMNIYQPIVEYVGSQLGIPSAVLDPLSEQESAACPDVEDTDCISERIAFGPALGLALSDSDHTPNLMFTYKDKERTDQRQADQPGDLRRFHGRRAHLLRRLRLPEPCHQAEEGGNRRTRNSRLPVLVRPSTGTSFCNWRPKSNRGANSPRSTPTGIWAWS